MENNNFFNSLSKGLMADVAKIMNETKMKTQNEDKARIGTLAQRTQAYRNDKSNELKGDQHKIDANGNGKVDAHDFKLLRGKKKVTEDAEGLDELSKSTLANYISKGARNLTGHAVVAGAEYEKGSTPKRPWRKMDNREKGIATAAKKMTKEEIEAIDELSNATLGSYVKKATNQAFNKGFAGGANLSRGQEHEKEGEAQVNKAVKRVIGVNKAVNKMTKEEVEELDELSNRMLKSYANKANKQGVKIARVGATQAPGEEDRARKLRNRQDGEDLARTKLAMRREEVEDLDEALDAAARYGHHYVAIKEILKSIDQHVKNHKDDALKHRDYKGKKGVNWGHVGDLNQVHSQLSDIHDRLAQQGEYKSSMVGESINEATRGRPRKDLGYTINPSNKQKLMHDNPEHMKTLEILRDKGVVPSPAVEPGQHIMNQLQKAKLSMREGEKVTFGDGSSHVIPGHHAASILTKYAGMKPSEKEIFQKKISKSHEAFKSEL